MSYLHLSGVNLLHRVLIRTTVTSVARFPGASPRSEAKLPELRRQLFGVGAPMHTKEMVKQSSQQEETTPPLPGTSSEPDFLAPPSSDDSQEPAKAGSPNRRRRANAQEVEDALTQIVATLQGLQQQQHEMAH